MPFERRGGRGVISRAEVQVRQDLYYAAVLIVGRGVLGGVEEGPASGWPSIMDGLDRRPGDLTKALDPIAVSNPKVYQHRD